jgi:hypothetical protein
MHFTKQTLLLTVIMIGTTVHIPTVCDHTHKQKKEASWTQRIANTVYENRLTCAIIPLLALGARL